MARFSRGDTHYDRERECERKTPYDTKAEADDSRVRHSKGRIQESSAYHCRWCGFWHWGRRRTY